MHIFIRNNARAIKVYTFVTLYEFARTCAVIAHFLNASTDTVSYAVRYQNFLREGEGAKPGHENFVNNQYNYNFINIQSTIADFLDHQNIKYFLNFGKRKSKFLKIIIKFKKFCKFLSSFEKFEKYLKKFINIKILKDNCKKI